MIANLKLSLVGLLAMGLVACSAPFPAFETGGMLHQAAPKPSPEFSWQDAQGHRLPATVREAVHRMAERIPEIYRSQPILVGTVVDANHVGASAPLGRMLSEHLQAAMVAHGFGVLEMRLRETVAIRETAGELLLSRDVQDLAKAQQASLAVMGTYTAAETMTFVHLKAVRVGDGVIEATAEFAIPNDVNVRRMLGRY
jgi:hypothetical protein